MKVGAGACLTALLVVLGLPYMAPEVQMLVRNSATSALFAYLVVLAFAKIPVRVFVYALRLLSAIFASYGLVRLWQAESESPASEMVYGFSVLLISFLAFASIGEMVPVKPRKVVYGAFVAWTWLAVGSLFTRSEVNLSIPAALMCLGPLIAITGAYAEWAKTGQSPVVKVLENLKQQSTRVFNRWASYSLNPYDPTGKWYKRRFARRLSRIAYSDLPADERYNRILEVCRQFSDTALSWQIAYATALSRKDALDMAAITLGAQRAGFGEAIKDSRPAPEDLLSDWRRADPTFARLERMLSNPQALVVGRA